MQADIADDVQVRNVELLVNGEIVRNDVSFPFDLQAIALGQSAETSQVTVQLRATDTGGNVGLSLEFPLDVVADTFAPTIVLTTPGAGSTLNFGRQRNEVQFSESMDVATLIPANFALTDSADNEIPLLDLQVRVNTIFDSEKCILCGGCADVCPELCLELVSLDRLMGDELFQHTISERAGDSLPQFSAIVKDETRCIRCGLCAERCPTNAITMERLSLLSTWKIES